MKFVPIIQHRRETMKKNNLIMLIVALAIVAIAAFKVTNAESKADADKKDEKSVAWFVANTKDARDQNKQCHDNPGIQTTPNCLNSLHALQISFAGGNRQR
jgi:invasion protein IalB